MSYIMSNFLIGLEVPVTHINTVKLSKLITFKNVLCVLLFAFNFLSSPTLTKFVNHLHHTEVSFTALMCKSSKYFNTYCLHSAYATNTSHNSNLWHYRLGYISNFRLQLIRDLIVIIKKKLMFCYQ